QDFARKNNASRLLFDVSTNRGGFTQSTFALQWYVVPNADDICFDNVRHMTINWQSWVSSFGVDYNKTIDKFFNENPRLVGDPAFIRERFEQLYLLLNYADQLFSDSETTQESPVEREEVPRLKKIERAILSQRGVIGYCYDLLEKTMPSIAKPTYDAKYWTEVAFVTDGSCGSACSSFTQTLQLS
ncbi:hypothetical protein FOZ62_015414, partial [Perkinsus olseni]